MRRRSPTRRMLYAPRNNRSRVTLRNPHPRAMASIASHPRQPQTTPRRLRTLFLILLLPPSSPPSPGPSNHLAGPTTTLGPPCLSRHPPSQSPFPPTTARQSPSSFHAQRPLSHIAGTTCATTATTRVLLHPQLLLSVLAPA